VQNKYFQYLEV